MTENQQHPRPRWMSKSFWPLLFILTACAVLGAALIPAHAQLAPGDILVTDPNFPFHLRSRLLLVNPATGHRKVQLHHRLRSTVFEGGEEDPGQGPEVNNPRARNPYGVAVEASGTILLIDPSDRFHAGKLYRVHPPTTARTTLLSDFANRAQGPRAKDPLGVAVEASGTILVVDPSGPRDFLGSLFRVDPTTGARTRLSKFGDPEQGPVGGNPRGVAVEASGTILAIGRVLFRVDPATGVRTVLSQLGGQAVAVEASGTILVISGLVLFRVDPTTGAPTPLSDFGDPAQGPVGKDPRGVAVEASGTILVIDCSAGTDSRGALFRVNATTGARTVLSDLGNRAQGRRARTPTGVAVVY